ncbi:MAG TPA: GNAT family N-acetyltransferase [Methylibium sp.]|nr:GNAT family N-acetyltransferase [Methylibium sp.]
MSGVLTLEPVTAANLDAVCALQAGDGGRQVAPNQRSMAQAAVTPEAWPRAICVDGVPVGFLMLYDPSLSTAPEEPDFYLWRLMIDVAHQGRGHGSAAVQALIAQVRTRPGATRLTLSYVPPAPALERLYRGLGFAPTGRTIEGELEMSIALRG